MLPLESKRALPHQAKLNTRAWNWFSGHFPQSFCRWAPAMLVGADSRHKGISGSAQHINRSSCMDKRLWLSIPYIDKNDIKQVVFNPTPNWVMSKEQDQDSFTAKNACSSHHKTLPAPGNHPKVDSQVYFLHLFHPKHSCRHLTATASDLRAGDESLQIPLAVA